MATYVSTMVKREQSSLCMNDITLNGKAEDKIPEVLEHIDCQKVKMQVTGESTKLQNGVNGTGQVENNTSLLTPKTESDEMLHHKGDQPDEPHEAIDCSKVFVNGNGMEEAAVDNTPPPLIAPDVSYKSSAETKTCKMECNHDNQSAECETVETTIKDCTEDVTMVVDESQVDSPELNTDKNNQNNLDQTQDLINLKTNGQHNSETMKGENSTESPEIVPNLGQEMVKSHVAANVTTLPQTSAPCTPISKPTSDEGNENSSSAVKRGRPTSLAFTIKNISLVMSADIKHVPHTEMPGDSAVCKQHAANLGLEMVQSWVCEGDALEKTVEGFPILKKKRLEDESSYQPQKFDYTALSKKQQEVVDRLKESNIFGWREGDPIPSSGELRKLCDKLGLSNMGTKIQMIDRMVNSIEMFKKLKQCKVLNWKEGDPIPSNTIIKEKCTQEGVSANGTRIDMINRLIRAQNAGTYSKPEKQASDDTLKILRKIKLRKAPPPMKIELKGHENVTSEDILLSSHMITQQNMNFNQVPMKNLPVNLNVPNNNSLAGNILAGIVKQAINVNETWAQESSLNVAEQGGSFLPNVSGLSSEKRQTLTEKLKQSRVLNWKEGDPFPSLEELKQKCRLLNISGAGTRIDIVERLVNKEFLMDKLKDCKVLSWKEGDPIPSIEQLKDKCKERGLSGFGTKFDMIKKLNDWARFHLDDGTGTSQGTTPSASASPSPVPSAIPEHNINIPSLENTDSSDIPSRSQSPFINSNTPTKVVPRCPKDMEKREFLISKLKDCKALNWKDGDPIPSLEQLKDACKERGISAFGTKFDMIKKLTDWARYHEENNTGVLEEFTSTLPTTNITQNFNSSEFENTDSNDTMSSADQFSMKPYIPTRIVTRGPRDSEKKDLLIAKLKACEPLNWKEGDPFPGIEQLKERCRERGLSAFGTKFDMINKLTEWATYQAGRNKSMTSPSKSFVQNIVTSENKVIERSSKPPLISKSPRRPNTPRDLEKKERLIAELKECKPLNWKEGDPLPSIEDLKERCRERGLAGFGTKFDMIKKLNDWAAFHMENSGAVNRITSPSNSSNNSESLAVASPKATRSGREPSTPGKKDELVKILLHSPFMKWKRGDPLPSMEAIKQKCLEMGVSPTGTKTQMINRMATNDHLIRCLRKCPILNWRDGDPIPSTEKIKDKCQEYGVSNFGTRTCLINRLSRIKPNAQKARNSAVVVDSPGPSDSQMSADSYEYTESSVSEDSPEPMETDVSADLVESMPDPKIPNSDKPTNDTFLSSEHTNPPEAAKPSVDPTVLSETDASAGPNDASGLMILNKPAASSMVTTSVQPSDSDGPL